MTFMARACLFPDKNEHIIIVVTKSPKKELMRMSWLERKVEHILNLSCKFSEHVVWLTEFTRKVDILNILRIVQNV